MSANVFNFAATSFPHTQGRKLSIKPPQGEKKMRMPEHPTVQDCFHFDAPAADFNDSCRYARLQSGTNAAGRNAKLLDLSTWEFTNAVTVYTVFMSDWNNPRLLPDFTGPEHSNCRATSWPNPAWLMRPSQGGNNLDVIADLAGRNDARTKNTNIGGAESSLATHKINQRCGAAK
jgi:hypothetical protein